MTGEEVIQAIRRKTDTITLAFSCGKDSIGAWLALRPHFTRIVPVYMYLVPDLDFVDKSIRYYEEFFQTPILQVPHPSLIRLLRNLTFQAPENINIIERCGFAPLDYDKIIQQVKIDLKLPKITYHATGVRAADSPIRRAAVNRSGAINEKRKQFMPIWDWNKARLLEEMKKSGVKLPIDYKLFGRSFDGIDYRFLKPIKDNLPDDYQKIIEFFPLADLEIKRREYANEG
jgi:hypothetical protein